MSWRLEWDKNVLDYLGALLRDDPDAGQRLIDACLTLAVQPYSESSSATGVAGLLGVVEGDWCVIYAVDERTETVRLVRIGAIGG